MQKCSFKAKKIVIGIYLQFNVILYIYKTHTVNFLLPTPKSELIKLQVPFLIGQRHLALDSPHHILPRQNMVSSRQVKESGSWEGLSSCFLLVKMAAKHEDLLGLSCVKLLLVAIAITIKSLIVWQLLWQCFASWEQICC